MRTLMTTARMRTFRLVGTLALVSLLLSACSLRYIGTESLETAIPTALETSDLGITKAEVSKQMSGISITVSVWATFEHNTVTAEELREMLQLIVDNANQSGLYRLEITALVGEYKSDGSTAFIDLWTLRDELGIEGSFSSVERSDEFSANWDDVVAYLDEHRDE
jgi:hypothetical protein